MSILCCFSRKRASAVPGDDMFGSYTPTRQRSRLKKPLAPPANITVTSFKSGDLLEFDSFYPSPFTKSTNQIARTSMLGLPDISTTLQDNQENNFTQLSKKMRNRFSIDSVLSNASSPRKKPSLSEEELERRKELKRALHQRVRDEIFEDRRASQGGYDTDAEVIATPSSTRSRKESAVQISSREFERVMRKLRSSVSLDADPDAREEVAGENLIGSPNIDKPIGDGRATSDQKRQKSNVPRPLLAKDSDASLYASSLAPGRPPPTFADSNWRGSKKCPKSQENDIGQSSNQDHEHLRSEVPPAGDYTEIMLSPDLLPLRLPSLSAATERALRLSLVEACADFEHCREVEARKEQSNPGSTTSSHDDEAHRGSPVLYPGVLSPRIYRFPLGSPSQPSHACNPEVEEDNFGGVDGGDPIEAYLNSDLGGGRFQNADNGTAALPHEEGDLLNKLHSASSASIAQVAVRSTPNKITIRSRTSTSNTTPSRSNSPITVHKRQFSSSSEYVNMPGAWEPVSRDNASSIYSHHPSIAPSPSSSMTRIPNILERLRQYGYKPAASLMKRDDTQDHDQPRTVSGPPDIPVQGHVRRRTVDTSSFQSSTDSFRARELAAMELRIAPKARTFSNPKSSKFKEELDVSFQESIGTTGTRSPNCNKKISVKLQGVDGSDEWYSSGQRTGYGYAFASADDDQEVDAWNRAIMENTDQSSAFLSPQQAEMSHARSSTSLHYGDSELTVKKRRSILPKSNSSFFLRPKTSESVILQSDLTPGASSKSVLEQTQVHSSLPAQSPTPRSKDSWACYPSHDRAVRAFTPAGLPDDVIVRDFVNVGATSGKPTPKSPGTSGSGYLPKSKSMNFSKVFKSWGNLYKSHSLNFSRREMGYRSSVSTGRSSDYPELDILPDLWNPLTHVFDRGAGHSLGILEDESDDAEIRRKSVDFEDQDAVNRSAKVWSMHYQDCVERPTTESEECSMVDMDKKSDLLLSVSPMDVSLPEPTVKSDGPHGSTTDSKES
ncbi:hypothetical protein MMC25_002004 [Agyrium rufum]|nr:hypothetical protein [Agyrium rufum]